MAEGIAGDNGLETAGVKTKRLEEEEEEKEEVASLNLFTADDVETPEALASGDAEDWSDSSESMA